MPAQPSSAIVKLHADILVYLFTIIAHVDPPGLHSLDEYRPREFFNHKRKPLRLGWTRLTHVCSLWRKILIYDLPSLWAEIVLAFPCENAYAVILDRARSLPITLRLHRDAQHSAKASRATTCDFIRTHCERAQVLDLAVFHPPEDWSDLFNHRVLPRLRRLRLGEDAHSRDPDNPALHIQAPVLLYAQIHGGHYPSIALQTPLLVHLDVMLSDSFTMRHLLDILLQTPLLEDLRIQSILWLDGPHWSATDDDRRLSLPRLDKLGVTGCMEDFLPAMRLFSRSASIRQLNVHDVGQSECAKLQEALDMLMPSLAAGESSFNSLYISFLGTFQICAFNWQEREHSDELHRLFIPPRHAVYFRAQLYWDIPARAQLASQFCAALAPAKIESLTIECSWGESRASAMWTKFSSVTAITFIIHASGDSTPGDMHAIDIIREIPTLGNEAPLFPRLYSLRICVCGYKKNGKIDPNDYYSGWWNNVIGALVARSQTGKPIRRLIVCEAEDDRGIDTGFNGRERAAALVEELVYK
ncbi:unnamed protein product [Peniophora sp. CBMAI 1063]|nr:unnamed protein product [Peniophora sp. CBMAI 1063]